MSTVERPTGVRTHTVENQAPTLNALQDLDAHPGSPDPLAEVVATAVQAGEDDRRGRVG